MRWVRAVVLGLVAGLALVWAMAGPFAPATRPVPAVVAWIGDEPISWLEVEAHLIHSIPRRDPRPYADALAALDDLIRRRVLRLEAQQAGITVAPRQARAVWEQLRAGAPPEVDPSDSRTAMLEERLQEDLLILRLAELILPEPGPPEEAELRALYEERPHLTWREPRLRLRRAAWATFEEAQEAEQRLQRRERFARVAAQAMGPEAAAEGDLGWVAAGELPPHVSDQLLALPPGGKSEIIKVPLGYAIYQVIRKDPGGRSSFEEVRDRLREELLRERRMAALREWYAGCLRRHRVKLDLSALIEALEGSEE